MDIYQVTPTLTEAGSRRGLLGLLAMLPGMGGLLALLDLDDADAERRRKRRVVGGENHRHKGRRRKHKKKHKKKCQRCPQRDTCPQQACCSCTVGGGEPELCGTIEPGATNAETHERCIAFCPSSSVSVSFVQPAPDTTALCDPNNTCRHAACPLP